MSRIHGNPNTVLSMVRTLLEAGDPHRALELLQQTGAETPALTNARGVCLLRLGQAEKAARVFSSLVLPAGAVTLIGDAPTVYKTNFATALLFAGNISGCLSALHETRDEEHPAVRRLRAAIDRWKGSLSRVKRFFFRLYGQFSGPPVPLDFPPGDLDAETEQRTAA